MNYDFTELDRAVRSWRRNNPKVKISNTKTSSGWIVCIYADVEDQDDFYEHKDLNKYVNWASSQLEYWPDVCKTGYNIWIFAHERDAEKFVTLFSLFKSQ